MFPTKKGYTQMIRSGDKHNTKPFNNGKVSK